MASLYKDKKVVVIGIARSGIAAAHLLREVGAEVFITDSGSQEKVKAGAEDLQREGFIVEIGGHTLDFIRNKDLMVVSPGVSNASQALRWADALHIPVISEIELAWSLCPATVIAVTGTNGKTTVTTLMAKVLEAAGKKSLALGNIGKPFSQEALNLTKDDFVSLEVSSFQLETIRSFKPRVSVILNLTPDHLDRYKDMQEYLQAKKRIFMNQDEHDFTVLNYDDPALRGLSRETRAKTVFFSMQDHVKSGESNPNPNYLAVKAVANIFAIPEAVCEEVFLNFNGVEHRMEVVRTINEIDFINDSKATNVDSTVWALHTIHKPAFLIAGGRDKNSDYRQIADVMKLKVKLLVLFGEAKDKIHAALKGVLPIREALSLEEAVKVSFSNALPGDCVLLSPMCASFDMFENYEHRGRVFKEIVYNLK